METTAFAHPSQYMYTFFSSSFTAAPLGLLFLTRFGAAKTLEIS
jgi:hypothetical protein